MVDKNLWCFFQGCSFLCLSFFIIIAMDSKRWFYQEDGIRFHGGLLRYEMQDPFYDCLNYSDCSSKSDYPDAFENLHTGGVLYIALSSVALVFLVAASIFLGLEFADNFSEGLVSVVLVWAAFFFNTLGYILWAAKVKLVFKDDCDDVLVYQEENNYGANFRYEQADACADSGANFGLAIIFILLAESVLHSWLYRSTLNQASQNTSQHIPEPIPQSPGTDTEGTPKHFSEVELK